MFGLESQSLQLCLSDLVGSLGILVPFYGESVDFFRRGFAIGFGDVIVLVEILYSQYGLMSSCWWNSKQVGWTYDFAEQQDVFPSYEEDTAWYICVDILDEDALDGVLED